PELWTPRAATVVGGSSAPGAESLFDGDATTGITVGAGNSGAVRLDLGATRNLIGLGIHGAGRAKIAIFTENDRGARTPISAGGDADFTLRNDRWVELAPARPIKSSVLVVQWTAWPSAPAALTELALWVGGPSREAQGEVAIADRLVTE